MRGVRTLASELEQFLTEEMGGTITGELVLIGKPLVAVVDLEELAFIDWAETLLKDDGHVSSEATVMEYKITTTDAGTSLLRVAIREGGDEITEFYFRQLPTVLPRKHYAEVEVTRLDPR